MTKILITIGLFFICASVSIAQLYEIPFEQKLQNSKIILEGKVESQSPIYING